MAVRKKAPAKTTETEEGALPTEELSTELPSPEKLATPSVSLGNVVIVYPKGSQHWTALIEPKLVQVEGVTFIEGTQVTGNPTHRFERKRTLMPFENVGTIVEFQTEEDVFSRPQPRNLPPLEDDKSPVLTHHEQGGKDYPPRGGGGGHRRGGGSGGPRRRGGGGGRHGGSGNPDARFQQQYESPSDKNFNR